MTSYSRFVLSIAPALAIGAACSKKSPPPEPTKAPLVETKAAEDASEPKKEDAAAAAPDAAAAAPDAAAAAPDAAAAAPDAAAPAGDTAAAAPDAAPPGPAARWTAEGMSTPESVLVLADGYLVSNIGGSPFDKDDNGFIAKLDLEGKVVDAKWIDGSKLELELNAPKGMAIQGDVLWVADIDAVRKFDAKTGAPLGAVAIQGATFLNDVAASATTVYVSDTALGADFGPKGTAAVYAITGDAAKPLELKDLTHPNGIEIETTADGDVLYLVSFDASKTIARIDLKTMAVTSIAVPGGSLDGLEVVKDGEAYWYFVSSWETGSVYKLDKDGKATVLASGIKGPADFGVDDAKDVVVVPVFQDTKVQAFAY